MDWGGGHEPGMLGTRERVYSNEKKKRGVHREPSRHNRGGKKKKKSNQGQKGHQGRGESRGRALGPKKFNVLTGDRDACGSKGSFVEKGPFDVAHR